MRLPLIPFQHLRDGGLIGFQGLRERCLGIEPRTFAIFA